METNKILLQLLFSGLLLILSGPCALFFSSQSSWRKITPVMAVAAGMVGLATLVPYLGVGGLQVAHWSWPLPWGGFNWKLDSLTALFLVPIFVIGPLGAVYADEYWNSKDEPETSGGLGVFYGALAGAMVFVTLAADAVTFLMAWESMALSAYFASSVDHTKAEVREAGWVYLVATHIGTLLLVAMFLTWYHATGSFELNAPVSISAFDASVVFVLAVTGFGFKAGLIPLHLWLPAAHAGAPSHVSALMSGVMLKMGIYGIVRMTALMPMAQPWWGYTLVMVGVVTGLGGILFAIAQTDIKRLLAYSSIENVGIITIGLGLAVLGEAFHKPLWVLLGLVGAFFHLWNHSLFKSLLFLSAGSVMHATHSRNIERMGGMAKFMPRTALLAAVGVVAICGLPPLNGFVGEWLLYIGFFTALTVPNAVFAVVAIIGLCTIGALAVMAFSKWWGGVFLGQARSDLSSHSHDPGFRMLVPVGVLALACILVGVFPSSVVPGLELGAKVWAGKLPLDGLNGAASLGRLGLVAGTVWIVFIVIGIAFKIFLRRQPRNLTWDCGYAVPTARMQYTSSSYVSPMMNLFRFILKPTITKSSPRKTFQAPGQYGIETADGVLNRIAIPAFSAVAKLFILLRLMQQGRIHLYLLYILLALVGLQVLLLTGFAGV